MFKDCLKVFSYHKEKILIIINNLNYYYDKLLQSRKLWGKLPLGKRRQMKYFTKFQKNKPLHLR